MTDVRLASPMGKQNVCDRAVPIPSRYPAMRVFRFGDPKAESLWPSDRSRLPAISHRKSRTKPMPTRWSTWAGPLDAESPLDQCWSMESSGLPVSACSLWTRFLPGAQSTWTSPDLASTLCRSLPVDPPMSRDRLDMTLQRPRHRWRCSKYLQSLLLGSGISPRSSRGCYPFNLALRTSVRRRTNL